MTENVYKQGLLYLHWIMTGVEGKRKDSVSDPEWKILQQMKKVENINSEDLKKFEENLSENDSDNYNRMLSHLVILNHIKRTRALAWMDLVMFADGFLHEKEIAMYDNVISKFEIDDDEVKLIKDTIVSQIEKIS